MGERTGLILTGGGARAAYQIGVLKAIAEFLPRHAHNPFPVICGTSAGSLNAAALAVNARNFRRSVRYLVSIWQNFHTHQVYRTDVLGVLINSARWVAGLLFSVLGINRLKRISLLDNAPLAELLNEILPCEKIQQSIDDGLLHALSITASGYESGESVTFYQGVPEIEPWHRIRRVGVPASIEVKHLLASAAIPFIFPATMINREYFGDGSMRQIAPVSSALHLGATHSGKAEHIVNELPHMLGFGAHPFQVRPPLVIQPWAIVFQECQGPAVNSAQRRPQVVGNRITERLQFPVGRLQLGGAFPDAPFQFAVEGADFGLRLLAGRPGTVQVLGDGPPNRSDHQDHDPGEPQSQQGCRQGRVRK